jgi:uncharacterized protein (DUF952 family)
MDAFLYHITPRASWTQASAGGSYAGDTLATEGFIHCSTRSQVLEVANRLFRGRQGLVLLVLDPGRIEDRIAWENLEGGRELYPHVYGPIPREAVRSVVELPAGPNGSFSLPPELD